MIKHRLLTKSAFREFLDGVMHDCIRQNFQLPFIMCLIGTNGSILSMQFDGFDAKAKPDALVEHGDYRASHTSLLLIMDQRGKHMRWEITLPQQSSDPENEII